jgi:hypothetical protein
VCSADVVEGFNVFKGLAGKNDELRSEKMETGRHEDPVAVRRRKEVEREIEVIEFLQCTCVDVLCHAHPVYLCKHVASFCQTEFSLMKN